MIPILYEATEKAFTTNGLGRLSDVTVCTVTEERNGSYELEFEYPATGIHYDEIKEDRLVYAKPSEDSNNQIFRIYKVTEPDENGIATISAEHISYLLNKIPVMPFTAESCAAAISLIESYAAFENPFEFWTDKETVGEFILEEPTSIRSLLGGEEGSLLDVYGKGEYLFDNFTVRLYLNRGHDNGVTIRYGKNLTELNGTIDMSNVYTGVVPYWKGKVDGADRIITIPEKVIWAPDTHADEFAYRFAKVVNFSSDFKEQPTDFELGNKAREYLVQNEGWTLTKNIEVSFISLWQTEEYKDIAPLEKVHLCDTVTVIHPELNISVKMKVIKTEFDVLTERYNSIELGDVKEDLNGAISELIGDKTKDFLKANELEQQTSFLEQEIDLATRKITGGLGGYVVFRYNANEQPEEILILDNPDIDQAVEVMRINRGGIGFSHTGYEGPFTSAWTIDGRFVADFISTGTLRGNLIKAGVISDAAGVNYWDMVTGEFRLASTITVGDKTVDTIATEKANAAKQEAISTANTNARNYTDTTLGAYAADVSRQFDNLQDQIDGQIETWYYDYVPTLNNLPASNWSTEAERENHSGDIFYYKSKGYAYRFQKSDEIWGWVLIQDTDITTAIGKAQDAEDLADQKRRVFITTPQVPYDIGDLWVEGISGDIWRCKTPKDKDGYYETRDWELASKYTDDTKAQEAWDIAHTALASVSVEYYLSTSKTQLSGGVWTETAPEWRDGYYMWSRTKSVGKDGAIGYSDPTCIAGATGATGPSGVGIESVSISYGKSTTLTRPTVWQNNLPNVDEGEYLWTRTIIDYTDSTMEDSVTYTYAKQGESGQDGTSVSITSIQYQAGTSSVNVPSGQWSDTVVSVNEGEFLWTKTLFSSGEIAYSVAKQGESGISIRSVTITYGVSNAPTDIPISWTSTLPTVQDGYYLWTRTVTDYTDSSIQDTVTYSYAKQGEDGADGAAGTSVSVSSIQYQAGTSGTVAPTGTWYDDPVLSAGQFLWTKTTFSDGTVAYGVSREGVDGRNGTNGTDGVGILSVSTAYGVSDSPSEQPEEWSIVYPSSIQNGKFLWVRTITDYTDPNKPDTISYLYSRQGNDGEDGVAGTSVTVSSIVYQAGTSPTTAPTGSWSPSPVEVNQGQYLWSKTTFSDGTFAYGVARQGEDGEDGEDGVSIASVTVSYGTSNSASTIPSTWQSTLPTVPDGDYLWTRTITDYTDQTVQDTVTYTYSKQGRDGENGQAGTSVSITSILYQAGSSPTVAPTGTWQSNPVQVSQGQFLWTKTTFSDESEAYSVARQGEDGVSISSVTVSYGSSSSATSVPSTWSETIPTVAEGDYLWTRTVTDYTDPNVQDTVTYVYSRQGEDGENGQNGSSVTVTRIEYNINTSWYNPPADSDSGWRQQIYEAASPYYLWTRVTFSDGTKMYNKVKDGDSVQQIKEQYYVSTSNTTQTGGSWSYDSPTWEEGKYIWTRSVITLRTDATHTRVQYSDPVLANIFNDMYDHVETVSQTTAENYLQTNLDQERVFNALTNDGEIQGIFMQGGELYINSSYVTSGTLRLGGTNNTNGLLEVVDEYRFKNVQLDITGLNSYGRLLDGRSLKRPESWWYTDDTIDYVEYDDYGWPLNSIDSSKTLDYVGWEYGNRYLKLRSLLNAGRLSFFINDKETLCIDVTQTSTIDQSTYLPDTQEPIISDSSRADYHPNKTYYLCHAYTSFLVLSDLMFTNSRASSGTSGSNPSEIMTVKSGTSGVVVAVDFTVRGRKNRVVETDDYSNRLLYSYETPSPMFGDVGEAITDEDGLAYVSIDDIFAETVSSKIEYQVFLQKEGPGDIWVEEKNASYFVVKGTPDLKFSWELKGIQKDFEAERLEPPNDTYGYSGPDLPSFDDLGDLESFVTEQEEILYGY